MIVIVYFFGYDINLPRQDTINCQKLLRGRLYYRVTHLHFGTPGGKIVISIKFDCFLMFNGPLPGLLDTSELSEIANSFATVLPLIFAFIGKRTLEFGHPLCQNLSR